MRTRSFTIRSSRTPDTTDKLTEGGEITAAYSPPIMQRQILEQFCKRPDQMPIDDRRQVIAQMLAVGRGETSFSTCTDPLCINTFYQELRRLADAIARAVDDGAEMPGDFEVIAPLLDWQHPPHRPQEAHR